MKITQYCSVCREELPMEVVPTDDGEEDGVIWLRCPRCQGFLPKISSSLTQEAESSQSEASDATEPSQEEAVGTDASESPGAAETSQGDAADKDSRASDVKKREDAGVPEAYEAMLAEMDVSLAVPYRSWDSYEIGDVVHHLAWDDCGVVVAKETLPGNRRTVKVYFEKTGIVRLIEADQAEA